MKYLKLFTRHLNYEDYIIQNGILRPNVSHCVDQKCVHYNPKEVVVSATIRTSDFDEISGIPEPIEFGNDGPGIPDTTPSCQFKKSSLYYYKLFDLIQRENNVNIRDLLHINYIGHIVMVTYSLEEYERLDYSNYDDDIKVLLSQDGSLISAAVYNTRIGAFENKDKFPYFNDNGDITSEEYTGKYDLHVSYAANLINPEVNAVLYRYTILQDDGIQIPIGYFEYYFNEQNFLNGDEANSLWLDMDGTVRGIKKNGKCIKDKYDNYITKDIIPRFDENGDPMYDGNNGPIYYNDKYIVKTPIDDIPFSEIRIDGEKVDLEKLVLDNRGFYLFEEGEYTIEYILKTRKEIPSYAFNSCAALEEVKIPKKVTRIKENAFAGCPLLGTDEETVARICSFNGEPIVVEAEFDFEEGKSKVLQYGEPGIFYLPVADGNNSGTKGTPSSVTTVRASFNYYVINNNVVGDVDCVMEDGQK